MIPSVYVVYHINSSVFFADVDFSHLQIAGNSRNLNRVQQLNGIINSPKKFSE
jgi:hypothetical protein